jgi:hypothetical protein
MVIRIEASTGNYYGGPAVWEKDGKFFIGTEDYSGWHEVEISKEFFEAWVKEFKSEQPQTTPRTV